MRRVSPFQRRAAKRARRQTALRRAPRHPPGPEAHARYAVIQVMTPFTAELRREVMDVARRRIRGRLRRLDAAPPAQAKESFLSSAFARAREFGTRLIHGSPFKQTVTDAGHATAASVRDQTADALTLGANYQPDLSPPVSVFADALVNGTDTKMDESIERVQALIDEWGSEEIDPDMTPEDMEAELDALDAEVKDGLDGIVGGALALVGLAFAYLFGKLVELAQRLGGSSKYLWIAIHDEVVRPAHLALDDGTVYEYDDPPLTADESSNEEDCNPGDDYNCRCVASPLTDEEAAELEEE